MLYVITLGTSIFSFHPENKTMYLTFRYEKHAEYTKNAIVEYIKTHKTLPPTYPDARVALEMNDSSVWPDLIDKIYINEIEEAHIMELCNMQHIGFLEAIEMNAARQEGSLLKLSYAGGIYEPVDFNIDDFKLYLDGLSSV